MELLKKYGELAKRKQSIISQKTHDNDKMDNPILNFQNTEAYYQKQKSVLKDKCKQVVESIDHYTNLSYEMKKNKLENNEKITSSCLQVLEFPEELWSS